jgi:predicted Zn-dependent protease
LAEALCGPVQGGERVSLLLSAESSSFIRFNRGAVRQATHVDQAVATLSLVHGRRHAEIRVALGGRVDTDIARLHGELDALRGLLPDLPDDPYLLLPDAPAHSERHDSGELPDAVAVVQAVARVAAGLDFVGFYAGGPVVRAFADSLGSRHWHHVRTFHFDWCLYHAADKAVKTAYAGTLWSEDEFARRVAEGMRQLAVMARPPRLLAPGAYRAWFTPTATAELLGAVAWAGFGLKERRTGTSALMRLAHRDAVLHPDVEMSEHTALGTAPAFTAEGFARPARVSLIERGLAAGTLNSARSAQEFGLAANGANSAEVPESLSLSPGRIPEAQALAALGTGLWIGNLWYLNYSDRQACRLTGLTRFACLWVEDGRPVEPIGVMRFDDSFLRMFGEGLLGLGDRAELITENDTYLERQLGSKSTPGALVEGWRLTL